MSKVFPENWKTRMLTKAQHSCGNRGEMGGGAEDEGMEE